MSTLQRLTDPAERSILDLSTAKTVLRVTSGSNDDEIRSLARTVTLAIASQLEREYWSQTWRETVSQSSHVLRLALWPVSTIHSLTSSDGIQIADYERLSDRGYPDRQNQLYRAQGWNSTVVAEYTAGWRFRHETGDAPRIPDDIHRAAIVQLKDWYFGGSFEVPAAINFIGDSGGSVRFRNMDSELLPAVVNILRTYE